MNIAALGGLPGALVFWFLDTLGPEGILRLMRDQSDRSASVSTCIAYCDGPDVRLFEGVVEGTLSSESRGANGFGHDPIFIPDRQSKTYAEMTAEEKNALSMPALPCPSSGIFWCSCRIRNGQSRSDALPRRTPLGMPVQSGRVGDLRKHPALHRLDQFLGVALVEEGMFETGLDQLQHLPPRQATG